jgi:vacuolar-type H+-ATPase subunit E/Vma4
MALTKAADHAVRALARLAQQFKAKPRLQAVLDNLNAQTQALEDALWQLYSERLLETAVGAQLDNLGRILDQARESATDDEYRVRLRARMIARRSSGTTSEVLAVFRVLLPDAALTLTSGYPAGFDLELGGVAITSSLVSLYVSFLKAARAAGLYAALRWIQGTEASSLYTAQSCTMAADYDAPGTGIIPVDSTSGFPESGTLLLDPGGPDQEAVTYTYKTPATFEGVSATTLNHGADELVALSGGNGLGFGDHNNAAVGGELAGAAEA